MKGKIADIAGAILAGGKNSRMQGLNKAFVRINGVPVIERTIGLLKEIFGEIILVTNSPPEFESYKKEAVITEDAIRNIGPLGGIHSALSATSRSALFFVACDMPFLHNGLILRQLEYFETKKCDALIPAVGDCVEPLHAIYKKSLAEDIRRFVKNSGNYSIGSFMKTVDAAYWNLEDSSFHRNVFRNINTKEDLEIIQGLSDKDAI